MTDQLSVRGMCYNTEPGPIGNRLQSITAPDVSGATAAWNAHLRDVSQLEVSHVEPGRKRSHHPYRARHCGRRPLATLLAAGRPCRGATGRRGPAAGPSHG